MFLFGGTLTLEDDDGLEGGDLILFGGNLGNEQTCERPQTGQPVLVGH
jgi:hypothetical protein